MDAAMFQLRSFVHQRLYTAAEEILGEVEKTIKLAFEEGPSKDEAVRLQDLLDLRMKAAAERSLTSSTVESEDECDAPLLNQGPSTPEDSNCNAEIPGPSQTSSDQDNNNWNYCSVQTDFKMPEIKEEQEELWDDGQTQEMYFSSEIVKSEQDLQEGEISYELQPVSSDCSAAQSENNDSDDEGLKSKGEQTMKQNERIFPGQSGSVNEEDQALLPHDKSPAKSGKRGRCCHFCGKGFQYVGSLMKHIKTHEKSTDCTVCGMKCQSKQELIGHLKSNHNKTCFCGVCGKTFDKLRSLRLHEKIHKDMKEFVCQDCGKIFSQKVHLSVHMRTHSGEKPYHCDICGKAFSQSTYLTIHKRSHSGEKPFHCSLCGKLFNTSSHLKTHMRYHTGEKPYPCDICGKRFRQSGQMTTHRTIHTGERPYGCHICGIRYRYAPGLKLHLKSHEKAATE
ncbi:zinc finger protein OZF-like [Pseudochaenichthys georgianus]|uniref:zinc finger protein OZF-like n=1 Tax=Pseudochaenichthys georgianus TaxID=52239 RepID=UPI00146D76DB|nr:zinc finger protein 135-like [Pseudochaenichthys georgianus]